MFFWDEGMADSFCGRRKNSGLTDGEVGDKPGAALTRSAGAFVQPTQHPARQSDVDPLRLVIQKCRIDFHDGPYPAGKFRVLPMRGNRRRRRNYAPIIERSLDPCGNGFAGVFNGFVNAAVRRRKSAGKIGHHHTPSVGFITRFNGNRIFHSVYYTHYGVGGND